jgi:DNA-binding PadR family transcriptional regulator
VKRAVELTPAVSEATGGTRAQAEQRAGLAECALLGLIFTAGGQAHGYALIRQFGHGQPLTTLLRLESTVIYYYLKKLAQREWITITRIEQRPLPSRHLCQITASGHDRFWAWNNDAHDASEQGWEEFVLKLFLIERLAPARIVELVDTQYVACQHLHAELARRLATDAVSTPTAQDVQLQRFSRLVVQLQLRQLEASMAWLRESLACGDAGVSQLG